jgi:hypothetical protein
MDELHGETRISMKKAACLPCHTVDVSTVRRWCSRGIKGVYLEHFMEGGRIYTTEEAVARFLERCNNARRRMRN